MHQLPEIAGLVLQPIQVPSGWRVEINNFYQLDPTDDLTTRQVLHLPRPINDPWDDVLVFYFDVSWLWRASSTDNRFSLAVEWLPMADRNGEFVVKQFRSAPMAFSKAPVRTLKRKHEDVQIRYELTTPVIWPDAPERVFQSRNREDVTATVNRWLDDCSSD